MGQVRDRTESAVRFLACKSGNPDCASFIRGPVGGKMRAKRVVWCALIAVTALLVLGSATVAAGSSVQSPQVTAAKAKVGVKYTVRKFVRSGNRLVAYGTATARYIPVSGAPTVTRKPFKATVTVRGRHFAAVQTICPVLELTLGPLDLSLLGAIVHLDKVHLVISADSEGGVLGKLLCNLAKQGKLGAQTQQLNWSLQKSGLATNGTALTVSVGPSSSDAGSSAPNALTPSVICDVLDLTLAPTDLNLLGLLVHLDQVHLTITADSEGGVLGSLLCSLAGGGTG